VRRAILILLVAAGLAPGLFWREIPPPPDTSQAIHFKSLLASGKPIALGQGGNLRLTGSWQLTSGNAEFGSYSALLALDAGSMLAFSDRGKYLRFKVPPVAVEQDEMGALFPDLGSLKHLQDVESATRDAASRTIWLGIEGSNSIARMGDDFSGLAMVQPVAMRDWPDNRGPEAFVRLRDGRFVVIAESGPRWSDEPNPGAVFSSDPVAGGLWQPFGFKPPSGFLPTDMAQLPDGRVLILLRSIRLGLPFAFGTRIVIADPTELAPGKVWPWRDFVRFDSRVPSDNYEGMAVAPGGEGEPLTIWLISDDNGASVIQRTLLTRLEWNPPGKE